MAPAGTNFVADELRRLDPDRYFASLVLKPETRSAVQAIYAFSADIASIRERARDPRAGEIRLQWWADALGGEGHGAVRQNPLAAALLDAIAEYGLPTVPLLRLIAARRFDLYDDPMPDVTSFEGYAGETASVLHQYAAMILNGGTPVEPGDAAGHLGVAQALAGHLRAFGANAALGRIMLPWSVLSANGVNEAEIFTGRSSEGLAEALGQLAEMAREHAAKAEAAIAVLPPMIRPAFAAVALLPGQLALAERQVGAPFSPPSDMPGWQKIARLSWWAWRNG
jgi:phytoene synthase